MDFAAKKRALEERYADAMARVNDDEKRRARTRRLILLGAAIERLFEERDMPKTRAAILAKTDAKDRAILESFFADLVSKSRP